MARKRCFQTKYAWVPHPEYVSLSQVGLNYHLYITDCAPWYVYCISLWLLVKTSTNRNVDNQNVDKPKRRQTKTSTNQNVNKPKRRQTKTSTNRNVHKPKRRQTKTSTNQNVDRSKRRQIKTSTNQNVDTLKLRYNSYDILYISSIPTSWLRQLNQRHGWATTFHSRAPTLTVKVMVWFSNYISSFSWM